MTAMFAILAATGWVLFLVTFAGAADITARYKDMTRQRDELAAMYLSENPHGPVIRDKIDRIRALIESSQSARAARFEAEATDELDRILKGEGL